MKNVEVVKEYPYGKTLRFDTGNGVFEAYVPNNVDKYTNVMIYEHGAGSAAYSNNWAPHSSYLSNNECDSIIIRSSHRTDTSYYNAIVDYYGLESDTGITVSFSGGTSYALQSTANMIRENPNCSSPVAVILDGYAPTPWLKNQGVVNTFLETDTVVFAFCQSNKSNNYMQEYENMAREGVNILILQDTSVYGSSHGNVNESFLYQGLNDYVTGKGTLPDNYKIKIFDSTIGDFRYLEYSEVRTLADVYNVFNVDKEVLNSFEYKYTLEELSKLEDLELKSDNKKLESYLNGIRSAIRSSSSTALSFGGFSSSTMMPSQVPAVVSRYLQSTTTFLSKLANETDQFAKIGESIEEMNFNLEREAREVNEIALVQTAYASDTYVKGKNNAVQLNNETLYGTNGNNANNVVKLNNPTVKKDNNVVGPVAGLGSIAPVNNTNHKNVGELKKDIIDNFDDIVSDNNRLVFENNDSCKIIIHKDGDQIIGFEHYYDFDTVSDAENALENIKRVYADDDYFDSVILKDNCIKVVFKKEVYQDWNLEVIEELYSSFDGYKKI